MDHVCYHNRDACAYLRYIWGGNSYLTVKGRGACTPHPDMPSVNCKSQAPLSNIETCPQQCPRTCNNGYCDCATGECLCNPGFSGTNCEVDLCAQAQCVNGDCAARYLGSNLPVSNKACICMEGWYGTKCDTTIPSPDLDLTPSCFDGCFFYPDSEITGGELGVIQTSDPRACCSACHANPNCKSWVINVICFLKTGTQRIKKPGSISGIKCSVEPGSSTTVATTTNPVSTANCDGKCNGQYPFGCNPSFEYGYCNKNGGCSYSTMNDPNWCCFKGCNQVLSNTTTTMLTTSPTTSSTTTATSSASSCNGKCSGSYPYGCNTAFPLGYCSAWGGCSYSSMSDPNWCCFKGC